MRIGYKFILTYKVTVVTCNTYFCAYLVVTNNNDNNNNL